MRAITAAEREEMAKEGDKVHGWTARLAARCMCDEEGVRLFDDKDIAALGAKSAAALDRVMAAISAHNALGEKEDAALGEASAATTVAGSPSSSQPISG